MFAVDMTVWLFNALAEGESLNSVKKIWPQKLEPPTIVWSEMETRFTTLRGHKLTIGFS